MDKRTGETIAYIGAEGLKKANRTYTISGEVAIKEKSDGGAEKQILGEETTINVQPIGTYKESKYKTIGFIPCEAGGYVAVKKKKHTKLLVGSLLALLLIVSFVGWYFYLNGNKKPDIDPNAGNYESALKRPDNINSSKILIPGYGKFTIKKGGDTIDTVLFNPEDNPCYFKFTIVEQKTKDVLYESKLVPPGQGITPVKLNKVFNEVGTYDAVLKFETVDFENTDITYNGSDMEVKLIVVE